MSLPTNSTFTDLNLKKIFSSFVTSEEIRAAFDRAKKTVAETFKNATKDATKAAEEAISEEANPTSVAMFISGLVLAIIACGLVLLFFREQVTQILACTSPKKKTGVVRVRAEETTEHQADSGPVINLQRDLEGAYHNEEVALENVRSHVMSASPVKTLFDELEEAEAVGGRRLRSSGPICCGKSVASCHKCNPRI